MPGYSLVCIRPPDCTPKTCQNGMAWPGGVPRRTDSAFPRFDGMLYAESENSVSGPDTAIFARDRSARPGQVFGRRGTPRTWKFQRFVRVTESVDALVGVRLAGHGIGVAKSLWGHECRLLAGRVIRYIEYPQDTGFGVRRQHGKNSHLGTGWLFSAMMEIGDLPLVVHPLNDESGVVAGVVGDIGNCARCHQEINRRRTIQHTQPTGRGTIFIGPYLADCGAHLAVAQGLQEHFH